MSLPPLSPTRLARFRTLQARTFDRTARVARKAPKPVSDGKGGRHQPYETVAVYPCRLSQQGQALGGEQIIAGRLQDHPGWTITLPWNANVLAKDRIEIDGRRFDVADAGGAHTNQTARQVVAVEVQP